MSHFGRPTWDNMGTPQLYEIYYIKKNDALIMEF